VERVAALVGELTAEGVGWTDAEGKGRPLTLDDVLIVSPYNAQVAALRARLPTDARVGTVDKFQGQEAPVVIYSMATSSADEAPRGMEFLFSLNRLNVATSRARCASLLVASPQLLEAECRTPHRMRLANALCRYRELAQVVA
jgi:superfamily I DNA and/or RNA helicase